MLKNVNPMTKCLGFCGMSFWTPYVLAVIQIYRTKGTVRLVDEVLKFNEILGPLGVQLGSIILTHAIPSCIFYLNGWIL